MVGQEQSARMSTLYTIGQKGSNTEHALLSIKAKKTVQVHILIPGIHNIEEKFLLYIFTSVKVKQNAHV